MHIRSVLVVAKKTVLTRFTVDRFDPKFAELLAHNDPLVARYRDGHTANEETLTRVRETLRDRGIPFREVHRTTKRDVRQHSLVISVGGDGTLLDASHGVVDEPVLAVNSAPHYSVGHFCGAQAHDFAARLDDICADRIVPIALNRIAVTVNGRLLPHPALNDILFAHTNPAATTRYRLCVGEDTEDHMSSGVWVSTAAGSSAAIHTAGGVRQPILSKDLQYLVRELYRPPQTDLRLTGGILSEPLTVISRLHEGAVFLDGHRLRHRVGYGDRVVVRCHEHPLRIFLPRRRPAMNDDAARPLA